MTCFSSTEKTITGQPPLFRKVGSVDLMESSRNGYRSLRLTCYVTHPRSASRDLGILALPKRELSHHCKNNDVSPLKCLHVL